MTKFMNRFILPKEWLKNFMNNDGKKNNNIGSIKNSVFLNTKKNRLKKDLDMEKIVVVVYEIMEAIIYLEFEIDYLIKIDYDSKNDSFDFNDINILDPSKFNRFDPDYKQIFIDQGYTEPHNSKKKINLFESTHELLNSKEDKKSDPNIRRVKSGKIRKINIKEDNKESNNLKGKKNNIKKIDTKNGIKNTEEENEENLDELCTGEKMHNISYNFTTSKKKEIKDDFIIINKNNNNIKDKEENIIKQINLKNEKEKEKEELEEDKIEENEIKEEFKNYFFNENQTMNNLTNYKGESIKPVGLINPSIYCFMICILQSLLSIPELNFFFLSKIYLFSGLFNKDNDLNLDKNNIEDNYPICTSYHTFIKIYLLSKKSYIQIPKNLFRICNKLLGGMRMHDSQEFFVCFLEALQQELNPPNKNKNKKTEKNKKNEISNKMDEKWIDYRKKNNSFIDSLFTGLMRSTVECKSCKHKSITYDPFIDLNISINKYKSLEKCLKQYFENEKIDCEYKCDNCKQISKVSIFIINYIFLIFYLGHKKIRYNDSTSYFNYSI